MSVSKHHTAKVLATVVPYYSMSAVSTVDCRGSTVLYSTW